MKRNKNDEFPVKKLTTQMDWDGLVLSGQVLKQIREIEAWILKRDKLMNEWGMARFLKPGYKTLFHGPPGTGKTLTANLLGKKTGRDVYRIDLSQVVSKYIGETEKNLSALFDRAGQKDWILFFDEADALFGKRTEISDSHGRYANQEISYLLQRIDDFRGLVILSTCQKERIDKIFLCRLHSVIHFPVPGPKERRKIWENGFGKSVEMDESIDLQKIAEDYEITGGKIINVIEHCMLGALSRNERIIRYDDVEEVLKR